MGIAGDYLPVQNVRVEDTHSINSIKEKVMRTITASESSIIQKAWYNRNTRILSVLFADKNKQLGTNNKCNRPKGYLYVGVPVEVFEGFRKAKSKGHYFASHIRGAYQYQKDVFANT